MRSRYDDNELGRRVRGARGFVRELINLAELQGWTLRAKDDGFLFYPPDGQAQPGYQSIFARDPGSDNSIVKRLKDSFRRAGMRFPEDDPPVKRTTVSNQPTKTVTVQNNAIVGAPQPSIAECVAAIRQKVGFIMDALSEIETYARYIEADSAQMSQLRQVLKQTLGGSL